METPSRKRDASVEARLICMADTERRAQDPGDCLHSQLDPNAQSPKLRDMNVTVSANDERVGQRSFVVPGSTVGR